MEGIGSMLTRTQRLVLGCLVLILVDVIWVASSELTKFIYNNETFEKPFFCTYLKTSMFTLYLFGFLFWTPWKDNCTNRHNNTPYILIDPNQDADDDNNYFTDIDTRLSTPTFIPVKKASNNKNNRERNNSDNNRNNRDRNTSDNNRNNSGTTSGTESDDSTLRSVRFKSLKSDDSTTNIRSVRFNRMAEVRQMSETEANEALLARLSYQASLRAGELAKRAASKIPVLRVAKIALIFCLLWFAANYSYQVALSQTEAGIVNVLSSTSSLFTLILSSIFPSNQSDKFTMSKLVAVAVSIAGIVLVSFSDMSLEGNSVPLGAVLSLISALFYATYLVFLRRKVDHEDKIDIPLFFGFVGLFNLILLWPLFFLLHLSQVETFELPTREQLLLLFINGLLGTVISEALWLWGCFLTSSLLATVAMSLTIPMTMLADVALKQVPYPILFYTGTIPTIMAFFVVTLLSHYDNWDPVSEFLRRAFVCFCRKTRYLRFRFREIPSEQTEALIGVNNEHEA